MKQGMSLQDMAAEVARQSEAKTDIVASTENVRLRDDKLVVFNQGAEYEDDLVIPPARLTDHAHGQVANRLGIHKKYYDKMRDEAPELLEKNVNHWFEEKPERRMIRTLDGDARAFLSDKYQRLDNLHLLEAVMPEFMNTEGWSVQSTNVNPNRLALKVTNMLVSQQITTIRGVDDQVFAGVSIQNSETGQGAVSVQALIWWEWCKNGAISSVYSNRKAHLGRKIANDGIMYSDEALRAEDNAWVLKARDAVRFFADPVNFAKIVSEIEETTTKEITGKVEKGVEVLSNHIGLNGDESESVLRNLINNSHRDGLTQYGLLNAVTAMSQGVEDYDRATEIEKSADKVINLPRSMWREISEAA